MILVPFALFVLTLAVPSGSVSRETKESVLRAYCKTHPDAASCKSLSGTAASDAVDVDVLRYCRALSMSYHVRCLHDMKSENDNKGKSLRRFKRQVRNMYESGYTKAQLKIICTSYREIYKTNCSVNADEVGKMKKYCDMYRVYCTQHDIAYEKEQQRLKQHGLSPFVLEHPAYPYWRANQMARKWPEGHFCAEYPRTCPESLRGADIMSLCQTFKFTKEQICPNYDRAEVRIGCNRYRRHCMRNAPPYTNYDDAEI
uniref:Uncharacterized protein n=1 Tax=Romanomermis culicivorax TaxID=13658 RepID=A0A915I4G1_ROMCU